MKKTVKHVAASARGVESKIATMDRLVNKTYLSFKTGKPMSKQAMRKVYQTLHKMDVSLLEQGGTSIGNFRATLRHNLPNVTVAGHLESTYKIRAKIALLKATISEVLEEEEETLLVDENGVQVEPEPDEENEEVASDEPLEGEDELPAEETPAEEEVPAEETPAEETPAEEGSSGDEDELPAEEEPPAEEEEAAEGVNPFEDAEEIPAEEEEFTPDLDMPEIDEIVQSEILTEDELPPEEEELSASTARKATVRRTASRTLMKSKSDTPSLGAFISDEVLR